MEISNVVAWLEDNISPENFMAMQQFGLDIAGSEYYVFALIADLINDTIRERTPLPGPR